MKRGSPNLFCSHWYRAGLILGLVIIYSTATPLHLTAQTAIAWVKAIAGNDYNAGTDIAVDAQGNVVIAGVYRDDIALDNNPDYHRANQGKSDIVLIKVAQTGDVVWMCTIGGSGEDRAFRIAIDDESNVFLTGSFERVIHFEEVDDTHTLESRGKEDMFLAKFNEQGQVEWSVQSGGTRSDQGVGLTVDHQGHVYVSGFFEGRALFGDDTQIDKQIMLESKGQLDAYLAKYDPEGQLEWANAIGGEKRDIASGIAVSPAGEVFITGVTRGPGAFIGVDDQIVQGAPAGQDDLFLARYTSTGKLDQLAYAGGRGFDAGNAIDIDSQGNVYVVGYFEDEAAMVDLNGNVQFIRGQSFDLFVTKFTTEGALSWVKTAGGSLWDNVYDVDVDDAGNVYVTGLFRKSADFTDDDQPDIEGLGEANAFVAKYKNNGTLKGLVMIEGAKSEGAGIAVNANGNVYLTGLFLQQAVFDGGQKSLISTAFNSFIAKYEANSFDDALLPDELMALLEDRSPFTISQNYPNPFVNQTAIEIELTETIHVRLTVHDALGRVLTEINNRELASGTYQFFYDASRLARGTYFYTMETPTSTVTRVMTLVR